MIEHRLLTASGAGLLAFFSEKADGNMLRVNADRIEVDAARRRFFGAVAGCGRIVRVRPSHSANIDAVEIAGERLVRTTFETSPAIQADFDYYYDGSDGIVCRDPSICVALISGDCVPLIFCCGSAGPFGILHVGLLGALNNMVAGLPAILNALGGDIRELSCFLGPSIEQRHYDLAVSGLWQAIEPQVRANAALNNTVIRHMRDGLHFDLKGLIVQELIDIGCTPSAISCFPGSTADPESPFFSHYDATQTGSAPKGFATCVRRLT